MLEKISIALADDHRLVLDGLQLILSQEEHFHLVGTASTGKEVISLLQNSPTIDVLILDINMPELNGLETLKIVRKSFPSVNVIGLSMMDEINIIKRFMELGAKGFLLKNSGKEVITEAIQKVSNNEIFYDPSLLTRIMQTSDSTKPSDALFPRLSRREKEILSLIIKELTTQEIADELFISFGTVQTHRRNIINKLQVKNTAGLVRVALQYKLLEE